MTDAGAEPDVTNADTEPDVTHAAPPHHRFRAGPRTGGQEKGRHQGCGEQFQKSQAKGTTLFHSLAQLKVPLMLMNK